MQFFSQIFKDFLRSVCFCLFNDFVEIYHNCCYVFLLFLVKNALSTIDHIMTVAQRLCDTGHYATVSIRLQANKLNKDWRTFTAALEERNAVLAMSVVFHKKAGEVEIPIAYLAIFLLCRHIKLCFIHKCNTNSKKC